MPRTSTEALSSLPAVRDGCQICAGTRGCVPGNGNRVEGLEVCDNCNVGFSKLPVGLVSASKAALMGVVLSEQLRILQRALADGINGSAVANEILKQMSVTAETLAALPLVETALPWQDLNERRPGPLAKVLVTTLDGHVREKLGSEVIELFFASVLDDHEPCFITHWTALPPPARAGNSAPSSSALCAAGLCGNELTVRDAAEVALFAQALRDKTCPYCAQPV